MPVDAAMPETFGVIGVGTMAAAIVRGLCRAKLSPAPKFLLGPRNREKSEALAREFPDQCRVVASNQEAVDGSDCVLLAVLPKLAEEVIGALSFREGQQILCVIGTLKFDLLKSLVAPASASDCALATPLPAVALQQGATLLFPALPFSKAIFDILGSSVVVEDEAQYRRMQVMTALMGDFYKRQLTAQDWLAAGGVPKDQAGAWVGAIFKTIAADSAVAGAETFSHHVATQTPGGVNEMVWKGLEADGAYDAYGHALNMAHHRYLTGQVDPELAPARKRVRHD